MTNVINLAGHVWDIKQRTPRFIVLERNNQEAKYYPLNKTLVCRDIKTGKFQSKKLQ